MTTINNESRYVGDTYLGVVGSKELNVEKLAPSCLSSTNYVDECTNQVKQQVENQEYLQHNQCKISLDNQKVYNEIQNFKNEKKVENIPRNKLKFKTKLAICFFSNWRILIWLSMNTIVFIICYLNYATETKHWYLYSILSAGLCFSRAAAMIININLLLVWPPMCKYLVTKLAFIATAKMSKIKAVIDNTSYFHETNTNLPISYNNKLDKCAKQDACGGKKLDKLYRLANKSMANLLLLKSKLQLSLLRQVVLFADNSKHLHFVCATTITIASVIHTVSHLINVVSFSRNYNPKLGTLNMAQFKGQRIVNLISTVPGMTGILMLVILFLMSLSSTSIIRSSRYDLFHILHKLSILFVALLLIHPSSHVLKEQSNVDRHNPRICSALLAYLPQLNDTITNKDNFSFLARNNTLTLAVSSLLKRVKLNPRNSTTIANKISEIEVEKLFSRHCRDLYPQFVNQKSISWLVLAIGLTFYLSDLLIRWRVRCKNAVELLQATCTRSSQVNGNDLLELKLSTNHRRFDCWSPGQFVYVNCPQVSACEWHPFTISTLDRDKGELSLHIKIGGDWTSKLKQFLMVDNITAVIGDSLSKNEFSGQLKLSIHSQRKLLAAERCKFERKVSFWKQVKKICFSNNLNLTPTEQQSVVKLSHKNKNNNNNNNNNKLGHIKTTIVTTTYPPLSRQDISETSNYKQQQDSTAGVFHTIDGKLTREQQSIPTSDKISVGSEVVEKQANGFTLTTANFFGLEIYIDGPFHSPFERLLEQQVSICISNGVGWTAFSPIFKKITNDLSTLSGSDSFLTTKHLSSNNWLLAKRLNQISFENDSQNRKQQSYSPLQNRKEPTNLHLMVIVTSIDQLFTFYKLVCLYSYQISKYKQHDINFIDPIKQICAFVTRENVNQQTVKQFCVQEKLTALTSNNSVRVSNIFSIYFSRPDLNEYLQQIGLQYQSKGKISTYCCGSSQVKKRVKSICNKLNIELGNEKLCRFVYHEEDF